MKFEQFKTSKEIRQEIPEARPPFGDAAEREAFERLIVLLEHAQCPNCDGSGARYDNYGEVEQCQWCHERTEALTIYHKQGG